ncbi:hypothetical protein A0J48_010230 [Sphaerospermopsis aphanizomenoides BCCUSP55]|uniref:hypothetical protein n=1 Tax=Sphaerospermopsis aphanizomenoides TaxID=459663 RepID=UPI001903A1AA|nr:hypothetical protein [Sphaerospermopsis aphanizomenoides]MBK1987912.1 hypothetical protein [Sphaerospermopsis aphanizomenoides BCCUSP55]
MISGCNFTPQTSLQAVSQQTASGSKNSASNCPDKPTGSLESKDVKPIQLSSQTLTETGQAKAGKYLGYTFTAKSGEKFNYQTLDTICVWVYAPDNQLITNKDLSQNGKYIVQVSAPRGSTTFSLNMSLENKFEIANLSTSAKSKATIYNKTSVPNQNHNYRTNSSRTSPTTAINNYYINLNQSDYRNAWNTLSNNLRTNKKEHPKGYDSYLEWWQQVKYIDTQILGARNSGDSATVTVRCKYNFASGRRSSATVKYYLQWSNASNTWKINRVERI